jgi:hypothetical protein
MAKNSTPASPSLEQDPLLDPTSSSLLGAPPPAPLDEVEDPIAKVLERWWRPMLTVAACLMVAWWGKQAFESTRISSMKSASEVFARVRLDFDSLQRVASERDLARTEFSKAEDALADGKKLPAKKGEADPLVALQTAVDTAKKKLTETEERLQGIQSAFEQRLQSLSRTKAPYTEISRLYKLAGDRLVGGALVAGAVTESQQYSALDAADPGRLVAELKALTVARGLLDQEGKDAEGMKLLQDLRSNGRFVDIAAGLAIAQIAESPADQLEARKGLESLLLRHAEQLEVLQPEIERLGGEAME